MNECAECGWLDNDPTFFYQVEGKFYCSLHVPCEECGVIHYEDENEVTINA